MNNCTVGEKMRFQQSWWEFLVGLVLFPVGLGIAAAFVVLAFFSLPVAMGLVKFGTVLVMAKLAGWLTMWVIAGQILVDGRW